jgi:NCS2 family nucleobase:cation symporter-2
MATWTVHGDGKSVAPGEVVAPGERLSWPRTIGIGMQHIAAMFGATFLVPIITGFSPSTTLLFSGIGTLLFVAITKNRVPSYLGSSFAFLGPIAAAKAGGDDIASALGGIVATGIVLMLVGLIVQQVGIGWIEKIMPPVVTGAIVMIIGLNLAGVAKGQLAAQPVEGVITMAAILVIAVAFRGFIARMAIFLGIVLGYVVATLTGAIAPESQDAISSADWFGTPTFSAPSFSTSAIILFLPVVLVLIAENVGHVKAVSNMTGEDLDPMIGRTLFADGAATTLAGFGGGSGTTTYAENIGVMAASRIYSTAAYIVAGIGAIVLSMSPKLGAVLSSVPTGVLGGAGTVLFGMIGVLGAKIWIENNVDFGDVVNLMIVAVVLVVGIADISFTYGDFTFTGIVNGTVVAVVGYQILRAIAKARGTAGK